MNEVKAGSAGYQKLMLHSEVMRDGPIGNDWSMEVRPVATDAKKPGDAAIANAHLGPRLARRTYWG